MRSQYSSVHHDDSDWDSECSYFSLESHSSFDDVAAAEYANHLGAYSSPHQSMHHSIANSGMWRQKKKTRTPRKKGRKGKFGAKGGRGGVKKKQVRKKRNVSVDQRTPIKYKEHRQRTSTYDA